MASLETEEPEFDLSRYIDILLRRRWVILSVAIAVFVCDFLYIYTTKPVYRASTLLLIEPPRGQGIIYSNNPGVLYEDSDDFYPTQYKLMKSESLLRQVYDELHLGQQEDFKGGVGQLGAAITITPVVHSRLNYLDVSSHDPRLAADIANKLAEAFVEQNLNNQLFMSKGVLQTLQEGKRGVDMRHIYDGLPAVVNNQLIQSLKSELAKLQAEAADMSARYTPKHPAVIAVQSNIAAVQSQIQSETEKIVQSLKTELSGELAANNVRIIDPAEVPAGPIAPRKRLLLWMGILGGLMLGGLLANLVEMIDQSVRRQEDVENKLEVPFLGSIPFLPVKEHDFAYAAMTSEGISLTSEAIRNLRTMVDFTEFSDKMRRILITSAVQQEGKSYISSNLAVAFAQSGQKVLLIDGDLRRPRLQKNFQLPTERGLSEFLASGKSVEELPGLIQPTTVPNLSVLVCGVRPPNPSELLNTPRLAALLSWASSNYDLVLVDTAPMFPINDTLIWGRHVRSTILTVRYGATRVPLIRSAAKKLRDNGGKILGAVVNAAVAGGLGYSPYNYYYHQYYQSDETKSKAAKA